MTTHRRGVLGIKTVDGTIVEVLDLQNHGINTEVFTTTVDRQRRARFDFFYREGHSRRWTYLDNLMVSRIPPARAGDPDLKIRARSDQNGNLVLAIQDSGSGGPQIFVVEGAALAARCQQTVGTRSRPTGAGNISTGSSSQRPGGPDGRIEEHAKKGRGRWIFPVLILTVAVLAMLLAGWKLSSFGREETRAAAQGKLDSGSKGAVVNPAETPAATSNVRQQSRPSVPERVDESAPAHESSPSPASTAGQSYSNAPDSELYKIMWGDTLWRITERFYGDRDLYPELAEGNNLIDPDLIIAGEDLQLPPEIGNRQRLRDR
jgi:nucleoid-associated protein YgaU